MFFKDIKKIIGIISITAILTTGCSNTNTQSNQVENLNNSSTTTTEESSISRNEDSLSGSINTDESEISQNLATETNSNNKEDIFAGYRLIEVDGGDLSGHREPNAVVDIGFGDRKYWAFTNEYGQLVRVVADKIILQDDKTEPVTSKGRYYPDEAKVPGVESKYLDEGKQIVL